MVCDAGMLPVGIQTMLETVLVDLATLLLVGPRQLFEPDGLVLEFFAELLVQRLVRHLGPLFLPDCRVPLVVRSTRIVSSVVWIPSGGMPASHTIRP